jgi:hypothetical protein
MEAMAEADAMGERAPRYSGTAISP